MWSTASRINKIGASFESEVPHPFFKEKNQKEPSGGNQSESRSALLPSAGKNQLLFTLARPFSLLFYQPTTPPLPVIFPF
ncbi:hypothetical protein ACN38_g3614 [Penicillium nordicum]|uniref:Uncharacterized protein n=1 Tax=Penicillium nordicum TaxID=229535 RepID=A0A0M8P4U3_9EURO|nr:hypothetical protein ACN38_g3614 [Penicillium nordicum]